MKLNRVARLLPFAALIAGSLVVNCAGPGSFRGIDLLAIDVPIARAADARGPSAASPARQASRSEPAGHGGTPLGGHSRRASAPDQTGQRPAADANTIAAAAIERSGRAKVRPVNRGGARVPDSTTRTANIPRNLNRIRSRAQAAFPEIEETMANLSRASIQPQMEIAACWPRPTALIEQLTGLTSDHRTRAWAESVMTTLQRVPEIESLDSTRAGETFATLRSLANQGNLIARRSQRDNITIQLRRAVYALTRRLDLWEPVHQIAQADRANLIAAQSSGLLIYKCVGGVEKLLAGYRETEAWRKYLRLDEVRSIARDRYASPADQRRIARSILAKMTSPSLNESQLAFFAKPELRALANVLRTWAAEPVFYPQLLRDIEDFERALPGGEVATAAAYQTLRWSANPQVQALGRNINLHYRNANLRIAVSEQFLNQLMPAPETVHENVRDRLFGADVSGTSRACNRVRIKLLPDLSRLRFGIEADGTGESATEARRGNVTIENEGVFRFRARKQLAVSHQGIRLWDAEAEAESETYITGVASNFDGVPVLGGLMKNIARQQASDQAQDANSEVERRLEDRIGAHLDATVSQELDKAERDFETKWLYPLKKLRLEPMVISMQTTAERMVVRYRLAGQTQLASHTARPLSAPNNWLSLQVHQSSINNIIDQLHLDGGTFTLEELYRKITAAFNGDVEQLPEDLPRGTTVTFADRDAIRLNFDDNRVRVTLRIRSLTDDRGRGFRTFAVSADYVPDPASLEARFVRDQSETGYIHVDKGIRKTLHRAAVAGIFSKVFASSKPISIMPKEISHDPRLAHLRVSQFEVTGGWIAFAMAPHTQRESDSAARTATRRDQRR